MAFFVGTQDYIARMQGGGARPNLYMIDFSFPPGIREGSSSSMSYLCKAASMPQMSIGTAIAPFMGRQVKMAGDRVFEDYTVTMISDTDMDARRSFEKWNALMNTPATNLGVTTSLLYYQPIDVHMLGRNGNVIHSNKIQAAYPTNVGAITLAYDNNDAIAEYTVTFAVNWIENESTGLL